MKVIVGMASRLRVLPTCLVLPFADLRGAHLHLGILFGNGKVFGKLNLCFKKKVCIGRILNELEKKMKVRKGNRSVKVSSKPSVEPALNTGQLPKRHFHSDLILMSTFLGVQDFMGIGYIF